MIIIKSIKKKSTVSTIESGSEIVFKFFPVGKIDENIKKKKKKKKVVSREES